MRHIPIRITALVALLCVASCSDPSPEAVQGAEAMGGGAAPGTMCALFKTAEIEAYVGAPLGRPTAQSGSVCRWASLNEDGGASLEIMPADFAPRPPDGSQARPELGPGAYLAAENPGWRAAARDGTAVLVVTLAGPSANIDNALGLLRETIRRHRL